MAVKNYDNHSQARFTKLIKNYVLLNILGIPVSVSKFPFLLFIHTYVGAGFQKTHIKSKSAYIYRLFSIMLINHFEMCCTLYNISHESFRFF